MKWDNQLQLRQLNAKLDAVIPAALAEGIEHIRAASAPLVPIETGRLVGSASVNVDAENDTASISYEGPYARYQHERLDLRHEHGQAKYLEQPMTTEKDKALDIVAHRIREGL